MLKQLLKIFSATLISVFVLSACQDEVMPNEQVQTPQTEMPSRTDTSVNSQTEVPTEQSSDSDSGAPGVPELDLSDALENKESDIKNTEVLELDLSVSDLPEIDPTKETQSQNFSDSEEALAQEEAELKRAEDERDGLVAPEDLNLNDSI